MGFKSAADDVNDVGTDTLTSICPDAPPVVPKTNPTNRAKRDFLIIDARETTTLKDFYAPEQLQN
jgi:hypothetical protein